MSHIRKLAFIIALSLLAPLSAIAAEGGTDKQIAHWLSVVKAKPNDMEALRNLCMLYLNNADFDNTIRYGTRLQQLAYNAKDYHNYVIYSHFILGEAYTMKGYKQTAYNNLMQAELNAKSAKKDSALCSVYNGLGLFSMNMQRDYYRALGYFFKGLDTAKRCRYDKLYNILLANIAATYALKQDTAGLRYALECHEKARRNGNLMSMFYNSINAASLYLLKNDLRRAEAFVNEAEQASSNKLIKDVSQVFCLRGEIAMRRGKPDLAATFYKKTIDSRGTNSASNTIHGYLGYGDALSAQGRYDEAFKAYANGLRIATETETPTYTANLLLSLSRCHELAGDKSKALSFYKQYNDFTDSMYNAEKERTVSDLRVRYDVEKQENTLKQNQLDLLKTKNHMQVATAVLAILAITATLLYILYRRKNTLYKAIIKQNQEAMRREQALQKKLDMQQNPDKYAVSSLTDERKQSLYARLEELMQDKKIYHDKLITKEKVADILGSNRTYLSQVINEQTGLTFTAYIGSLRIKEAVDTLSDPRNDTPLKALCSDVGFSSMTTFYSQFRQTTGMTPASYRTKVLEMSAENSQSNI